MSVPKAPVLKHRNKHIKFNHPETYLFKRQVLHQRQFLGGLKGDVLVVSRGEGEKRLNHHRTGDMVMDALTTVGQNSLLQNNVPRKHLSHYRERSLCSTL